MGTPYTHYVPPRIPLDFFLKICEKSNEIGLSMIDWWIRRKLLFMLLISLRYALCSLLAPWNPKAIPLGRHALRALIIYKSIVKSYTYLGHIYVTQGAELCMRFALWTMLSPCSGIAYFTGINLYPVES